MSHIDHYPLRVYGLVAFFAGLSAVLVVITGFLLPHVENLGTLTLLFLGGGWFVLVWTVWDLWKYVREKQGALA